MIINLSDYYLTFLTKPLKSWEQISSYFRISTLFSLAVRLFPHYFLWVRNFEVILPEVEYCTQVSWRLSLLYDSVSFFSLVWPGCYHHGRNGHCGRDGHHGRDNYHGRGQTGQTKLTFKLDFPANLWRVALAILAMFVDKVASVTNNPSKW